MEWSLIVTIRESAPWYEHCVYFLHNLLGTSLTSSFRFLALLVHLLSKHLSIIKNMNFVLTQN